MTPVDGVIDKDFALSKLASLVKADCFVVLTAVDNVMINFNKPNQKALKHTNKKNLNNILKKINLLQEVCYQKLRLQLNLLKKVDNLLSSVI